MLPFAVCVRYLCSCARHPDIGRGLGSERCISRAIWYTARAVGPQQCSFLAATKGTLLARNWLLCTMMFVPFFPLFLNLAMEDRTCPVLGL